MLKRTAPSVRQGPTYGEKAIPSMPVLRITIFLHQDAEILPRSVRSGQRAVLASALATEPRHPCRLTRVFDRRYSKTLPPRPLDTLGSFYENQGKDD